LLNLRLLFSDPMTKNTLIILSLAAICLTANGQQPLQLVKDISPNKSFSSDPRNITVVGDQVYFMSVNRIYGRALWKTDGTEEGTVLVKDVVPGADSYEEYNLIPAGEQLFFKVNENLWVTDGTPESTIKIADGVQVAGHINNMLLFSDWNGTKLWSTDGTPEGTWQVAMPGCEAPPGILGEFNGELYLSAHTPDGHEQLWKSDGTQEGTFLVTHFPADKRYPGNLTAGRNALYFTVYKYNTSLQELWKTDGTAIGTVQLTTLPQVSIERSIVLDNLFIFEGVNNGRSDLYRSDGTAGGTFILRVPAEGSASWTPRNLFLDSLNHQVYFSANTEANGTELWRTDGTVNGTHMVKDLKVGPESGVYTYDWVLYKNQLYFAAESTTYGYEMFKTNGTSAGTTLWKDLSAGSAGSNIGRPVVAGDFLFIGDYQLWKTDGTTAGTTPIQIDNAMYAVNDLTYANKRLFFVTSTVQYGSELYVSDGTYAGTKQVSNIFIDGTISDGSNKRGFCELNGSRYFLHNGIWKTDGTAAGTTMLKEESWPTFQPGYISGCYRAGSTIVFSGWTGTVGTELWKTDGTGEGTVLLKDIYPGGSFGFGSFLHQTGDLVYFTGVDAQHGAELWRTDGTESGTYMVKDVNPGTAYGYVGGSYELNGIVYFSAQTTDYGTELWRTDGTESGTFIVKDIHAGSASTTIRDISSWQGIMYFKVEEGTSKWDLWRSDGTESGTYLLKSGFNSGYTFQIQGSTNSEFYFSAHMNATGLELWKTDGTDAGTVIVKDVVAGTTSSYANVFDSLNGKFIFSAYIASTYKLYATDGTDAGTTAIIDTGTSNAFYIGSVNGKIVFSASTAATGNELWVTDGTAAGTFMISDIYPGSTSSNAAHFIKIGNLIYFTADDGVSGIELWQTDGTTCGTKKITNDDAAIIVSDLIVNNDQLLFMANSVKYGLDLFSYNLLTEIPDGCISTQSITFDDVDAQSYSDDVVALNASATSGLPITLQSSNPNVISINGTNATIKNAGTAFITVSQPGNLLFSKATPVRKKVTVTRAPLTAKLNDIAVEYGDSPNLEITYTGFVKGDDASDIDTPPNLPAAEKLDVGEHVLALLKGSDNNYEMSYQPGTITIEPAPLTFSADPKTKVYGDPVPELTYSVSGWKGSDDLSDIDNLPELTTLAQDIDAGEYAITWSGGSDNNYELNFENATLTVSKAVLTVTAEDESKLYGQEVPELRYTVSGFRLNDGISDLDESLQAECGVTMESVVGEYPITLSGGAALNYTFNLVPGNFSVKKARLILTPDVTSKIYGDEMPEIAFNFSGFKLDEDSDVINALPEVLLTVTSGSHAGDYEFGIVGGEDDQYEFELETKVFSVNKAALKVRADNASRAYGEVNPDFTFSFSGFVAADSESDIDVLPSASTEANAFSDVGTYPITIAGAEDNDYDIAYETGVLEIVKASQEISFETITQQSVDGPDFQLNATSNRGLTVQFTAITDNLSIKDSIATPLHSGKAVVRGYQEGNKNIESAWVEQEFCINPRKPELSINGDELLADANELSLTYNWFVDELAIDDSHDQLLTPGSPGTFAAQASKGECLSALSDNLVLLVTALEHLRPNTTLDIFPNPTTDEVVIETEEDVITVALYALDGRLLQTHTVTEGEKSIKVGMQNLPAGIYNLSVILKHGYSFNKMVMKN
jgi:ELWxxDGT repeat protein